MRQESNEYSNELRRVRSLLIVTELKKREDLRAVQLIDTFSAKLAWKPLDDLLIEPHVWSYAVDRQGYDPKFVFCHPDILIHSPPTCLYYRGLCGLSLKAARDYFGDVKAMEAGNHCASLTPAKALRMARTFNTFICSIIENSTEWTLENGRRTIIATLGITIDGVMRNRIGSIAEERIRTLVLEWIIDRKLLVVPMLAKEQVYERTTHQYTLLRNTNMRFGSDPDISFTQDGMLLAVVEIKGGIDPAGALERYGAATKSFQQARRENVRCKNFYLAAVFTPELERRISEDALVEKTFDIIDILEEPDNRDNFFEELFRYTLRLI